MEELRPKLTPVGHLKVWLTVQFGVVPLGWDAVQRDALVHAETSLGLMAESGERGFGAIVGCCETSASSHLSSQLTSPKETQQNHEGNQGWWI